MLPNALPVLRCVHLVVAAAVASVLLRRMQCQQLSDFDNPVVMPRITRHVYDQMSNMTSLLNHEIKASSGFCVKDP